MMHTLYTIQNRKQNEQVPTWNNIPQLQHVKNTFTNMEISDARTLELNITQQRILNFINGPLAISGSRRDRV